MSLVLLFRHRCQQEFDGVNRWRTILALARYGGLRILSELIALRWNDIDLPGGKMTINASKTEHHRSGGIRVCPIFPELRPYLENAWDEAPEGTEYVSLNDRSLRTVRKLLKKSFWLRRSGQTSRAGINRYRKPSQNLRQTFLRILKNSGIVPWPKLFHNLRASRETELMARFPIKDATAWLGNSEAVAMKHYAMELEESFQAAADPSGKTTSGKLGEERTPLGGCIGGCISGVSGAISRGIPKEKSPVYAGKTGDLIVQDSTGGYWLMGDEGLEKTLAV